MGWYYVGDAVQKGPVSAVEIERLLGVGQIETATLVWRDGMPAWRPLHEVRPELTQSAAAAALPEAPAPTALAGSDRCSACGTEAEAGNLVGLGGGRYCSRCKGLALQSLRERGQLDLAETGPRGVGGWLLFFCVGLTILQPGLFALTTVGGFAALSQQRGGISALLYWDTAIMVVFVAVSAVVGARIWAGSPQGRTLALRLLYARLPYLLVCNVAGLFLFAEPAWLSNPTLVGAFVGNLLREVLYLAVWVGYFKKSKRVRNTYGPE